MYSTNLEEFKKRLDNFRFNSNKFLYGPVENELVKEIIEENVINTDKIIMLEEKLSRLWHENAILKRKLQEQSDEKEEHEGTSGVKQNEEVIAEKNEELEKKQSKTFNFYTTFGTAAKNANSSGLDVVTKEQKYVKKIIKGLSILKDINKKRKQ